MNRDAIHQISHQEVKRKKRAGQKKIIHGMQLDAARRSQQEKRKEEKQQRNRREITDAPRERPRLQFLWQRNAHMVAGHQILEVPRQVPSVLLAHLLRRGKRVFQQVEAGKIRGDVQLKILYLRHVVPKAVAPVVEAMRTITYSQRRRLARLQ